MPAVLDSSAILAWLQQEQGSDVVAAYLEDGIVASANWAEILQKVGQHGGDRTEAGLLLRSLGLEVVDVTRQDGERAAELWTQKTPLSLGDRLGLAVAHRLGLKAVTAVWLETEVGVVVEVIPLSSG